MNSATVTASWLDEHIVKRGRLPGVLASRPDVPYLFFSPDLLIGHDGGLAAVFRLHQDEVRQPEALWARLAAAKLVLPAHLWTLLLVGPEAPRSILEAGKWNFDAIEGPDARAVQRVLTVQPRNPVLQAVPENLRRWQFVRSHRLLRIMSALARKRRKQGDGTEVAKPDRQPSEILNEAGFQAFESLPGFPVPDREQREKPVAILIDLKGSRATDRSDRLRRLGRRVVAETFVLDSGVPYPRERAIGVALSAESLGGLPARSLRAAAFHGCVVISPGEISSLSRLSSDTAEKHWNWRSK